MPSVGPDVVAAYVPAEGEPVVTHGAFILKSEFLKKQV